MTPPKPFTVPDPPADDPGELELAILTTRRQAWIGKAVWGWREAFVSLIPAAGSAGWWLTLIPAGEWPVGSADPVDAAAVPFTLRHLGVEPESATWWRDDRFGEEERNPYLTGDPRTYCDCAPPPNARK